MMLDGFLSQSPGGDGAGALVAGSAGVFINGIAVVNVNDSAESDNYAASGGKHLAPFASAGSETTFVGE